MKLIQLGFGPRRRSNRQLREDLFAQVSDHRFEELSSYRWHAKKSRDYGWYATAWINGEKLSMHRVILGAKIGDYVDHEDFDGLNNQDGNIRIYTQSQNMHRKRCYVNTSGFRGVSWDKRTKSWRSQIRTGPRCYKFLGRYADKVEAALIYDKAARDHFGVFACVNFPNAFSLALVV